MANNYTHLSTMVVFPDAALRTKAVEYFESEAFGKLCAESRSDDFDAVCMSAGFDLDLSEDNALWIHDDGESIDLETLAKFFQWVATNCLSGARIGFQWANTCSRPRIGEFNGGAFWTDGEHDNWLNTGSWLSAALVTNGF